MEVEDGKLWECKKRISTEKESDKVQLSNVNINGG